MSEINRGESDMEDGMRGFDSLICTVCDARLSFEDHEEWCSDYDEERDG